MPNDIAICTESGSDVPEVLVEKYGFYVFPMHVIMDTKTYNDGRFAVDKVYEYYERTGRVPGTLPVSPKEYSDAWNEILNAHPGSSICQFTYSSKAAKTYDFACEAAKDFDNVYIIDTMNVSGGCTAHLVKSLHLIQDRLREGITDHAKIAMECQELATKAVCHFIPGTLEYLRAGGRVSNAQFLGATLLKAKPLIEMVDGELIGTKRYRGSMSMIVDHFVDDFIKEYDLDRECLYLMYSKGLDEKVLDRLAERAVELGFKNYEYVMTGCVISCHGGKGAMGLAGMLV